MDLHFTYSDNNSPNFAGLFKRGYERLTEKREDKTPSKKTEPTKPVETPSSNPTSERWNPVRRGRDVNDRHAEQTKASAEAVQSYTGKATRATEGQPTSRPTPSTRSKQWSVIGGERDRRRALPYSGETPLGKREAPAMGRHAKKPTNPADPLGRHAAGPPPANEPPGPQRMGRHAR